MTTKIECLIDSSQRLSLKLVAVEGEGREFQLANVLIFRPPRISMLDPEQLFWAALVMFGPRVSEPVVTNLNVSDKTLGDAAEIWGAEFTVEQDDQTEIFAAETEDLTKTGRKLAVTAQSLSLNRRETNDSVLQVLPLCEFTGTMATLFDVAVTSNAAVEGERLYGDDGKTIGVLTVAATFAPSLQTDTLALQDDLDEVQLSDAQLATLKVAGLTLEPGQ